jgi:kynurenine 3-monooxygenase
MSSASASDHDAVGVTRKVVIAGAGPAGLLLAGLLLHRNSQPQCRVTYHVSLVEPRPDLGALDPETELKKFRSWMLGLAGHGLEALRTLPGLYEGHVAEVGVPMKTLALFLGGRAFQQNIENVEGAESFIVDRNFVVAAMSRFLIQEHAGSALLDRRYLTKLMYVDDDRHRVLVRHCETNQEEYLPYDLLVGCDGIRSTVRESILKRNFDFELEVTDIFNTFKAVHVDRPDAISYHSLALLPEIFPNMQGIALPEKDGKLNISVGVPRNLFDQLPSALTSDDPKIVAQYVKENFKAFPLVDYDDFAEQWTSSRWNRTGMVHCNVYHSLPAKLVLMGDAAHATSPSIGMGMNTALRDAQKFYELLVAFDDDLDQVLPEYSNIRVREGNALSDLALHLYCFDTRTQLVETLHQVVRTTLHGWFGPRLVDPHPQALIGNPKYSLAELYQRASDQGIIQRHRAINDRIRQQHFELSTGMLSRKPKSSPIGIFTGLLLIVALLGAVTAVAVYVVLYKPEMMMMPSMLEA